MDYVILTNNDELALSNEVREYMKHGWRPQGGVSITLIPTGRVGDLNDYDHPWLHFSQALIHTVEGAFQPGLDEYGYQWPIKATTGYEKDSSLDKFLNSKE